MPTPVRHGGGLSSTKNHQNKMSCNQPNFLDKKPTSILTDVFFSQIHTKRKGSNKNSIQPSSSKNFLSFKLFCFL